MIGVTDEDSTIPEEIREKLDEFPNEYHFVKSNHADDVIDLYCGDDFIDHFSLRGVDSKRLETVIKEHESRNGPRVS
ncbi:MAG: hypothetical protein V5A57_02780 [Candidatus Paceibacterota bacterium]